MTYNKSIASLALTTLWYSIALAAISETAQMLTQALLSLVTAEASDPVLLFGDLLRKIAWSATACEAVVLLSIVAKRKWLLLIIAAGASIFVGAFLGAFLRTTLQTMLGRATAFVTQAALDYSVLLGSKYTLVGVTVGWANRKEANALKNYLLAGLVAALGAAGITWVVVNAPVAAKLGTIAVDFVFPIGCTAVVWKVREMTETMTRTHDALKEELKKI